MQRHMFVALAKVTGGGSWELCSPLRPTVSLLSQKASFSDGPEQVSIGGELFGTCMQKSITSLKRRKD